MIYVYTSIVNGFDNLRVPACQTQHNVKYLCYTNLPIWALPTVLPWEYRPIDRDDLSGPKQARLAKILPHRILPEDAEYSIYHDGNFQLYMDPNKIIDLVAGDVQWAAHRHPMRKCIYDEAAIIKRDCPMVNSQLVDREIADYRAQSYPEHGGLWANGFLVRKHTPEVAALNESWWELFQRGCERDQLSFPVARYQRKMPVLTINENIWASPYILYRWHAAWRDRDDNPNFWQEREEIRARLATVGVAFPSY